MQYRQTGGGGFHLSRVLVLQFCEDKIAAGTLEGSIFGDDSGGVGGGGGGGGTLLVYTSYLGVLQTHCYLLVSSTAVFGVFIFPFPLEQQHGTPHHCNSNINNNGGVGKPTSLLL